MNTFMGLDIGTTHIKALALSDKGEVLAQGSVDTPVGFDRWGVVHDADALVAACQGAVQRVLSQLNGCNRNIGAISVASMGEEGFFLDEGGYPLYPAIAWFEQRIADRWRTWVEQYPEARFMTGHTVKPTYSLFKWLWMKEHLSDLWPRVRSWVSVSDYVGFRLSGELRLSYSQAARTYVFNPRLRSWIVPWIEEALPDGLRNLPEAVPSGTVLGLSEFAAKSWGLDERVAVVVGGHDHPVGAIGAGVINSSKILDSMGTAELLYWPQETLADVSLPLGFRYGYTGYPSGPYYLGAATYTGMTINTLSRLLQMELASLSNITGFAPTEVVVIPNLLGAPPAFEIRGISHTTQPETIMKAAVQSSAMVIRWALSNMPGLCSTTAPSVVVIGGGARDWVLKLKADILQMPLYTMDGVEMVALGAARIARMAMTGREDVALATTMVEPLVQHADYYNGQFEQFRALWMGAREKMG